MSGIVLDIEGEGANQKFMWPFLQELYNLICKTNCKP